jgi:hypothetical protein
MVCLLVVDFNELRVNLEIEKYFKLKVEMLIKLFNLQFTSSCLRTVHTNSDRPISYNFILHK